METVVIEAVSDKFKNKFNSGAVLFNGNWINVSSKVPLNLFTKDSQIAVEVETNAKGYKSIVAVGDLENNTNTTLDTKKVERKTKSKVTTDSGSTYEADKNRRIQVQGVMQAVVQSPATINFGDDVNTIADKVLILTDLLLAGMDERI